MAKVTDGGRVSRDAARDDHQKSGSDFCESLATATDEWFRELFAAAQPPAKGIALVAVGGYGRGGLAPGSDIDVVLLHHPKLDEADVAALADKIWYPVWDAGLKLGHAVRSTNDALSLASEDLATATAMLNCRLLAGDKSIADDVAKRSQAQWLKAEKMYLAELGDQVRQREADFGELAFLLEPNLKEARGGLRDLHALSWAETGEPWVPAIDRPALTDAHEILTKVRVALHQVTGQSSDHLLLELQDQVSDHLGYDDADLLMADVAAAGRAVLWTSNGVWNRIHSSLRSRRFRSAKPREVAPGVILEDRRIHLDRRTDDALDALTPLRVAVAAATHQAFIERDTLTRLADEAPPLPLPWPDEARGLLADLLLTGKAAIPVWEAFDQVSLIAAMIPEWEPCRSRPQRNAYHRFTVDRHLIEAATEAAKLADNVDRPDLLVLGALLHDIGKGYPGDHTEVGMTLVADMAPRMGFNSEETHALVSMVEHHLLLPDVATRRDLDDHGTLQHVAEQVGSVELLELLAGLTEADSIATGPSAWGTWKAGLVATLVQRTAHVLRGGNSDEIVGTEFPTAHQVDLIRGGKRHLDGHDNTLTVVEPDRPRLFARVAGVLALNGVDILEANVHSEAGMGLEVFRVAYSFGGTVPWPKVLADLDKALDGRIAIEARIAERANTYRAPKAHKARPSVPTVLFDNSTSATATVIEVSCPDGVGVLYRIVRTFSEFDLDIVSARVQTLMNDVIDSFYVLDSRGERITDAEVLADIERAVLFALQQ